MTLVMRVPFKRFQNKSEAEADRWCWVRPERWRRVWVSRRSFCEARRRHGERKSSEYWNTWWRSQGVHVSSKISFKRFLWILRPTTLYRTRVEQHCSVEHCSFDFCMSVDKVVYIHKNTFVKTFFEKSRKSPILPLLRPRNTTLAKRGV